MEAVGGEDEAALRFRLAKRGAIRLGGVWDAWKDPATEDWLQNLSIITTDPNELTATGHDRKPVILKPSDYDRWLDRTDAERAPVDLLRPYEAAEMTTHPVDPRVGKCPQQGTSTLGHLGLPTKLPVGA